MTVPAESKVTFVNRLGQNATLRIGGKTVTSVGANQAVPVVFHHGPVEVSMTISCSAGVVEEFRPVTVGVTPKPAAAAPRRGADDRRRPGADRRRIDVRGARGTAATSAAAPPRDRRGDRARRRTRGRRRRRAGRAGCGCGRAGQR